MKSLLLTSLLISAAVCLPSTSRTPLPLCNDGHHFTCKNGACIPMEWMCDNLPDCPDKDDEAHCSQEHTCAAGQFKCRNDDCFPKEKKCDGHSDCLDGSDEAGCEEMKTLTTTTPFPLSSTIKAASLCNDDHDFTCNNGSCIPMEWMCDNHADCMEAEDEAHCQNFHKCSAEQFKCRNDDCVPLNAKCNGQTECPDGSDEYGCTGVFASSSSTSSAASSSTPATSAVSDVNDASVPFSTYMFYGLAILAVIGLGVLAFNYFRRRRNPHEGAVKFNTLENAVYNDQQS